MKIIDVSRRVALAACFVVSQSTVFSAELQKLLASNGGANDEFGIAVAANGGIAVVGSHEDDSVNVASGSAYVFQFDPLLDSWQEIRQLVASDGEAADRMGSAVAVDGDFVLVGSTGADEGAGEAGAAYIFGRDVGGVDNWGEVRKLVASDGAPLRRLGSSVALSGDTAVLGTTGNAAVNEEGAVYIFQRNQGGADNWGEVKKLEANDGAPLNEFGISVSLDGDRLAVGAAGDSDNAFDGGSVYVFERNRGGADQWGQVRKVSLGVATIGDRFGTAVSLNGDTLLVGATEAAAAIASPGTAYIFSRNEGGLDQWGMVETLSAPDGSPAALFGAAVSISENAAVIGASEESNAGLNAGAAYLFTRVVGGEWSFSRKLVGSDTSADFRFGTSVSLDGTSVLVGAHRDDFQGRVAGSVYLFGLPVAPTLAIESAGGDVTVSWFPNRPGFQLEATAGLAPPLWAVAPSGSANPATIVGATGSGFYRLVERELLDIAFVPVGNPGRPDDPLTGLGGVSGGYQVGEFEVTNDEYAAFLNAVAATDTFGLYNTQMESSTDGGIVRSGTSGSFSYEVKTNMGNKPVNFVSFFDALRFANWLQNGQPSGPQDGTSTEDGAYTFTGASSVGNRNPGATVWLPSSGEWYKAAYHDPTKGGVGGYWLNPTRSDDFPDLATADATGNIDNDTANIANYGFNVSWGDDVHVTTVGSGGAGSRSFYGAADMGGNVAEWNESIAGAFRGIRGGSWQDFESALEATTSSNDSPSSESDSVGFRVARP